MNQKIREIYNKSLEKYTYSDCDGDNNHGIRLNEEKFTELIVKECIQVCNSRAGNSDYNTGRMHCVSDLKEHFGVQE